jgi:L-ascorbate metabolism protein UlaG (beta-lactamase superfamily)
VALGRRPVHEEESKNMKAIAILAGALLALSSAQAQTGKTEVLWLGHAAFRITSPGGKVIVIDPALTVMPATPSQYKKLDALGKVDLLLLTHGHWDHSTDAVALAKLNKIPLHAPGDLNNTLTTLEVLPGAQLPRANKGGRITPVPGIKVTFVRAEHSSIYIWRNPASGKDETHPGGEPVGYVIEMENGFKIWHMGDTGVFGDMKWIAEYYKPDLVMLPIGGGFTMDAVDAAYALREMIKPKFAMPMHYRVTPGAKTPPEQLVEALGQTSTKLLLLKPGEKAEF